MGGNPCIPHRLLPRRRHSPLPPAAQRGPYGEASRTLFQFKTAEDLAQWTSFSDAELGGKSTVALELGQEATVRCL